MTTVPPWVARRLAELAKPGGFSHHALLIHGPAGVGKNVLAEMLAASRLCESPTPEGLACGSCPACHWLAQGSHPDLRLLTLGGGEEESDDEEPQEEKKKKAVPTQIKVEAVREVIGFVQTTAHRKGTRVVIVNPAEALNPASANALLKTLEEPPPDTLFLLVSREPRRLPATVRSRCLRVGVPVPSQEDAAQWLSVQGVASPQALLARSGGAPFEALRLAEGEDDGLRDQVAETLSAPVRNVPAAARALVKSSLAEAVMYVQRWTHDVFAARFGGRVRFFGDRVKAVEAVAARANLPALLEFERALRVARRELGVALRPELVMGRLLILYARVVEKATTRTEA